MYSVTGQELDGLASGYNSIHAGFFTLCLGALIGFGTTLLTVPLSDKLFALYVGLTGVSGILTPYFGLRAIRDWRNTTQRIEEIKRNR